MEQCDTNTYPGFLHAIPLSMFLEYRHLVPGLRWANFLQILKHITLQPYEAVSGDGTADAEEGTLWLLLVHVGACAEGMGALALGDGLDDGAAVQRRGIRLVQCNNATSVCRLGPS